MTTRETAELTCEEIAARDIAERYLRSELREAERDAFEQHYFDCSACLEKLEALEATASILRASPSSSGQNTPRFGMWSLVLAAGIAALATAAAVWWLQSRSSPGSGRPSPSPPPAETAASSASGKPVPLGVSVPPRHLEELRHVEPLPTLLFRGASDDDQDPSSRAMEKYSRRDYTAAAAGFREALRMNPGSFESALYLGVCELLIGHDAAAIEPLRRVAESGRTSYSETARFYLAKAFLRKEDVHSARAELELLAANGSADIRRRARRLLDLLALPVTTP